MSQEVEYQAERLDHLGIVAGVCQEAELAEWLDKQARATWLDFCALARYTHPGLIEQEVDFRLCPVKWVHSRLEVSPQNVLSFREFDIRGEIVYACTFHCRKCFSRNPAI